MLELVATRASVVSCLAAPGALDLLPTEALRVAPDEAMLLAGPGRLEELVADASARLAAADPDAVALDTTDGWAVWTLVGDQARDAFARLSELELPAEGAVQGDVAHLPAKAVVLPDRIHLLVPAMYGDHLRQRILALGATERREPAAFASTWGDAS